MRKFPFGRWTKRACIRSTCATSLNLTVLERRVLLSAMPVGPEFRVNTYTLSNQSTSFLDRTIASDAVGNFVVVWTSNTQDGDHLGVYAQRYSSAGVAQGGEFRVNSHTTSWQTDPSVAMDADGDFVITWTSDSQDGFGEGVYGQRYNASGIAQGGEFRVNSHTLGNQNAPSVAMDADGDFVVCWDGDGQDGSDNIYAQRYDALGVPQGTEFRVNSYTTRDQNKTSVAMSANGDFIITWSSFGQDGDSYGIYAQRYSNLGLPQGGEFRVNSYTSGGQDNSSVAMDAGGNVVVTWNSKGSDSPDGFSDIFAQRYNASGVPQGSEFRVNSYATDGQRVPSVAMNADGDFVVSWDSQGQDGSFLGVYAQLYDSLGVPQGAEFRVNTYRGQDQQSSSVAMNARGDFVIAWSSYGQDRSLDGVYAQRYLVGNAAPISMELSSSVVVENAPVGSLVGTLSAVDPDPAEEFSWSLVAGHGDADNDAFFIVGDRLLVASPFDFEFAPSRTVRLRASDRQGLWLEQAFTITILDTDESPFIIDNGDAGFTTTGNWTSWSQDGHGSDLQWSHSSTGPATATWSFTGLTPGQYRVSSTWLAASNRATNAPYTIRSAAGGSVLGSALVNQQLAPGDFSAQGAAWDDLGSVTITGTTLIVELTNVGADQYIIADAIRIEPIPVTAPFVQIIDNGDAGYLATGAWTSWGQDGHGSDLQWSHSSTGLATATWSFTGLTPGEYRVSSTWLAAPNRATNASYSIRSATGTALGSALINQQHTPNDFSDQSSAWEDLGIVTITGTTLVVELTNVGADQYIIADAIRIERGPFSPPTVQVVDNGDAGYSTTGAWTSWGQDGRGSDLQWSHNSTGPATATWSFTSLIPGKYRVSTTWLAASNRATNASYFFRSAIGGSALGSAIINQQSAPNDFSDQGSAWENLSIVTVTGSSLAVELTNAGADHYIIADAIRIERIGD